MLVDHIFGFFKCLLKFTSEALKSRDFLCWAFFDYQCTLLTGAGLFRLFLHDLVLVGGVFLGIVHINC